MDKDFTKDKRRKEDNRQEFKNEFVENSIENESMQQQHPPIQESYESEKEPNGMDPEAIFEKGLSFQESPDEYRSQRMNRFGKEPNGIDPEDR